MSRSRPIFVVLFIASLAGVVAIWWSGLESRELGTAAGVLNAAGRFAGLVGTYLLFVQLVLRTHVGWLVTAFGKDVLKRWHTWNAYVAVGLIGAHVVLQVIGYALVERMDIVSEIVQQLTRYEGVLLATAGLILLGALTAIAVDRIRHRIAWPTWRALHLYLYAAVALALPHIVATGSDFLGAPIAVAYWTILEAAIVAILVVWRVPPLWRAATAAGRPHPAVVAVGAVILAAYLAGAARLAPAQAAAAPSPTPRAPPTPAGTARPSPSAPPELSAASLMVLGDEIDTPYGTAQVRVILASGGIADVEPVQLPSATKRSKTISSSVEPWLRKRAIAAQSADFEILSGATYTSHAYQASLASALRAAGMGP